MDVSKRSLSTPSGLYHGSVGGSRGGSRGGGSGSSNSNAVAGMVEDPFQQSHRMHSIDDVSAATSATADNTQLPSPDKAIPPPPPPPRIPSSSSVEMLGLRREQSFSDNPSQLRSISRSIGSGQDLPLLLYSTSQGVPPPPELVAEAAASMDSNHSTSFPTDTSIGGNASATVTATRERRNSRSGGGLGLNGSSGGSGSENDSVRIRIPGSSTATTRHLTASGSGSGSGSPHGSHRVSASVGTSMTPNNAYGSIDNNRNNNQNINTSNIISNVPEGSNLVSAATGTGSGLVGLRSGNDNSTTEPQEILTEYLVLDFTAVIGVDATAARSCFLMLVQLMRSANVTVVFANMNSHVETLFRAHSVVTETDIVIPHLDDALEWCEEQVLFSAGQYDPSLREKHTRTASGARGTSNDNKNTSSTSYQQLEQPQQQPQAAARFHEDPRMVVPVDKEAQEDDGTGLRGLSRDPSYYSQAWRQRQQLAKAKGRRGSGTASINSLGSGSGGYGTPQSQNSYQNIAGLSAAAGEGSIPRHGAATLSHQNLNQHAIVHPNIAAARMLRRILEDYLEVDSSAHPRLAELLSDELLVQYFARVHVPEQEVIFDIDEPAEKVSNNDNNDNDNHYQHHN